MNLYEVFDTSRHVTFVRAETEEGARSKFESWCEVNLPDADCRSVDYVRLVGPPSSEKMLITPVYLD